MKSLLIATLFISFSATASDSLCLGEFKLTETIRAEGKMVECPKNLDIKLTNQDTVLMANDFYILGMSEGHELSHKSVNAHIDENSASYEVIRKSGSHAVTKINCTEKRLTLNSSMVNRNVPAADADVSCSYKRI